MHFKSTTVMRMTVVATMVGVGLTAVAGPAQAALTTSCVGTAKNVTVPGDLVVPAGESCELTNVVVQGQATVRADANLLITKSTLKGNVAVRDNGYLDLYKSSVAGATSLSAAYGAYLEDSTVTGKITAADSGFLYSIGSSHAGQVASTNGETHIESGRLEQSLVTSGDALTDLTDTVINGKVSVADAEGGSMICSSEIDGNTTVTGAGADGVVQFGATGSIAACGFNVFSSNVTLKGNHSQVTFSSNVVRGNLSCSGNDVQPTGSNNRVRGTSSGQCKNLSTTAAAAATAKVASATDRASAILKRIDQRSKTGSDAAAAAGTAVIGR